MTARNNLFVSCILAIFVVMTACSSGSDGEGNSSNEDIKDVSVKPNELLYGEGISYSPGQVVVLESATPFTDGEIVYATDDNGNTIELLGQADGSGFLFIPLDTEPGSYTIELERESTTTELTLDIASVTYPINPRIYVSEYVTEAISQINGFIATEGEAVSAALNPLLAEISNIDFDSYSDEEIATLSKLLYVNGDEVLYDITTNTSLLINNITTKDAHECKLYATKFVVALAATGIGSLALHQAKDLTSAAAGLVLAGLGAVKAKAALNYYWRSGCGNIIDAIVGGVSAQLLSAETLLTTALDGSINSKNSDASSLIYAKAVTTNNSITFYDREAKPINVTARVALDEDMLAAINTFKAAVYVLSTATNTPSGPLISLLDSMAEPRDRDITGDVTLEQVNENSVVCTGGTSSYECGFPADNNIYDTPVDFTFDVYHPSQVEAIKTRGAIILPRDVPVINNQSFNVTPGPGQVNRIVIQVTEDTTSPNYELTKVIGYELVSSPDYGVILNEFSEPGVLDYAADITDTMPETTTLEVRVWNRYGWSDTATITLNLDNLCVPDPIAHFSGTWNQHSTNQRNGITQRDTLVLNEDGTVERYREDGTLVNVIGQNWRYSCEDNIVDSWVEREVGTYGILVIFAGTQHVYPLTTVDSTYMTYTFVASNDPLYKWELFK